MSAHKYHPITSVPKSVYISGKITLKDVFATKTFQFLLSVVVFIIMSLLITCNYFPRTYFARLEGRGVVLCFPVVSLGKKGILAHYDMLFGMLTPFIKPLSERSSCDIQIPKMAINGLVCREW